MVVCKTATPTLKSDYTGCVSTCATDTITNSAVMVVNGVPTCMGTTNCYDDGCGC